MTNTVGALEEEGRHRDQHQGDESQDAAGSRLHRHRQDPESQPPQLPLKRPLTLRQANALRIGRSSVHPNRGTSMYQFSYAEVSQESGHDRGASANARRRPCARHAAAGREGRAAVQGGRRGHLRDAQSLVDPRRGPRQPGTTPCPNSSAPASSPSASGSCARSTPSASARRRASADDRRHHHDPRRPGVRSLTTLRLSLRAGERIFVNGAVMRVDRKTSLNS